MTRAQKCVGVFKPTASTLRACEPVYEIIHFAPFSLHSLHILYNDGSARVCVHACTASLHAALNEPIMGVYVALMHVSVRRETLHRSPPNQ